MKYKFLSLLFSFVLIGAYCIRHHFLFKHIHNYNDMLVQVNLIVLLPIIFFPFTTAFVAESINNKEAGLLAMRLFLLNNILAGATILWLFWLAIIKHKELSFEMKADEKMKFTFKVLLLHSFS